MRKSKAKKNFDFYIDEYMYYCQSRRLRPKTMTSYEQTLRLFERWAREVESLDSPAEVREQTIRHYICDLQDRGKYSFYADEERTATNFPERRRDFREPSSITTINDYIRNLRAFFNWFGEEVPDKPNPMRRIRQLENDRKVREYLEDEEVRKLLNGFDKSYFPEARDVSVVFGWIECCDEETDGQSLNVVIRNEEQKPLRLFLTEEMGENGLKCCKN